MTETKLDPAFAAVLAEEEGEVAKELDPAFAAVLAKSAARKRPQPITATPEVNIAAATAAWGGQAHAESQGPTFGERAEDWVYGANVPEDPTLLQKALAIGPDLTRGTLMTLGGGAMLTGHTSDYVPATNVMALDTPNMIAQLLITRQVVGHMPQTGGAVVERLASGRVASVGAGAGRLATVARGAVKAGGVAERAAPLSAEFGAWGAVTAGEGEDKATRIATDVIVGGALGVAGEGLGVGRAALARKLAERAAKETALKEAALKDAIKLAREAPREVVAEAPAPVRAEPIRRPAEVPAEARPLTEAERSVGLGRTAEGRGTFLRDKQVKPEAPKPTVAPEPIPPRTPTPPARTPVVGEAGAAEGVKEPWQMTREEWRADQAYRERRYDAGTVRKAYLPYSQGRVAKQINESIDTQHALEVAKAARAGKPVPAEILAEYPELAPKAAEFTENTIFTQEVVDDARRIAREELQTRGSGGPSTRLVGAWARIGSAHIERGALKFNAWSREMVREFGDAVKPHLRKIWRKANQRVKSETLRDARGAASRLRREWRTGGMDADALTQDTRNDLLRVGRFLYHHEGATRQTTWARQMRQRAPGITTDITDDVFARVQAGQRPPVDIADRLARSLREAWRSIPGRKEEVAALRGRQYRAGQAARTEATGQERARRMQAALRDEAGGGAFPSVSGEFNLAEINRLYDRIDSTRAFHENDLFSRINAQTGLNKLLNGELPTPSELRKLDAIFGSNLTNSVRGMQSLPKRAWRQIVDALNLPRSLMASTDLSASLRQGGMLAPSHPKAWSKAFKEQLRVMFSEGNMELAQQELRSDPLFGVADEAKLYISPWGEGATLAAREERFMSTMADKLPWVRASSRAYVGFLNKLRFEVFRDFAQAKPNATKEELAGVARFINHATGRGDLGKYGNIGGELATVFFAPRYTLSRFQVWADLLRGPRAAQKEAAKSLGAWIASGMSLLTLADMAGADVELNARSSDFGKIRVGDTRFDIWAGQQQIVRHVVQAGTGERKHTETGKVSEMGRGGAVRTAGRFLRAKEAPTASAIHDFLVGKDYIYRDVEWDEETLRRMSYERGFALVIQDVVDAYQDQGGLNERVAAVGLAATFGVGAMTYRPKDAPRERR